MIDFCQLWLSCDGKKEATLISDVLLQKKLVACAKQIPVSSQFSWQDKIDKSNEILLIMESSEDLFDEVEREIDKLHSYDSFVLEATPISKISKKATDWLKKELKNVST